MSKYPLLLGIICAVLLLNTSVSQTSFSCPRTLGSDKVFAEPWPQADSWYGSDALAVMLPLNGVWPTTSPNALIAVKLFWYAAGYRAGMESDFTGRIERIDDGPNDAVISEPTNARFKGGLAAILTGIDIRSAGCWRIVGKYRGQTLDFVVETQDDSGVTTQAE